MIKIKRVSAMTGVREHYENHLARYYAWLFGGLDANVAENRKFFRARNIQATRSGQAFDLGAGCGFQSIPLAELGYRVIAMDLSARLLAQLKQNAPNLPIVAICDDLLNFRLYVRSPVDLVVCMGDTLTHLNTIEHVETLLAQVYAALVPGGCLMLSFRDLSQPLVGLDRFIPVRSSATTIFTCFLEYEKSTVKVHDIIYEQKNRRWKLRKSFYRKLRISPNRIQKYLQQVGFALEFYDEQRKMICIMARKN